MASESQFLRAIMPTLPTDIASKLRSFCTSPTNESMLENLVRLLAGGEPASDAPKNTQEQWAEKQAATKKVIMALLPTTPDKKRSREDESIDDTDSQQSKKPRLTGTSTPIIPTNSGRPLFSLHALSVTSPIRKKVDITVHQNAIVMTNPSTRATEATIPVSSFRRAFILPTRGKSKPHWTVVILSSDVPDKGKPAAGSSSENQQVIFGIDATSSSSFSYSTYMETPSESGTDDFLPTEFSQGKGTVTLPSLQDFLSHLKIPVIEPTAAVFKSACPGIGANAGTNGIPGVEAYRGAKAGSLWFSKEGILWGESKPCEFWPVEDLLGKTEGLRIVGSGRTCSVILTRRSSPQDEVEDEEDVGDETEFGMVDSKEREGITEWVRNHRHLFGKGGPTKENTDGKSLSAKVQNAGPITIRTLLEGSDSEDEDFAASVSDLDGSERSSNGSSSEEEDGDGSDDEGGGDEEDAAGSDAEHEEGDVEEEGDDDVQELDPAKHPLLRPGAMPKKISKAALEMAVGLVGDTFMGSEDGGEDDEEDELND